MAAAGRCPSCLGESTRLALHGHLECASFHTQSRTPSINRMATRPALHGRDLNTSARNIYQSHAHGRELNTFSAGTAIGNILCKRKLYECPTSGVFIYLPLFDAEELEVMYRAYNGQAPLTMTHFRPNEQAAMITFAMRLSSWVGPLHVVEAGCANGAFLAVLGASHLLKATPVTSITLSCYEADPKIAPAAQQLLGQLESNSSGRLQARVVRSLFTGADLQPASVDLVSSSHVLEHVTDPCTYVQTLRKVLRPGGYVFTEVPLQSTDHLKHLVRGLFHATFWTNASYNAMMERSGFSRVAEQFAQASQVTRQLHRML